nr:glycosyltransferase family 4 protein [uncultured Lichenicoccus sp.]
MSSAFAGTARPTGAFARRHRVTHVLKHCGYANGNVHVAVDLACVQAQAGYEVTFVSGGGTFVEMLTRHGVRHTVMPQQLTQPLRMLRSIFTFVRFCRSERPDVIHAHMTAGALMGYVASRFTGIPLVTTVHNSFDPQSVFMRLGRRIVAVSHAERDNLIRNGCNPETVAVVLNAPANSPRTAYMRNDRDIRLVRPCVVVICGLHRRKGVFDVIEAFSSVARRNPDWRLYIAGEGPDRAELEARAETKGLGDRVVFLGFLADPGPLFEQADIFVLASYADPGSLSIGEARAAGCAIIATGVGGTTEMLDHGRAGRLVAPGAPQQIAHELNQLMGNSDARDALGKSALVGADKFLVSQLVKRYEGIYSETVRNG